MSNVPFFESEKNDDGSNEGGHRFNMSYDPERIVGDDVFGQK